MKPIFCKQSTFAYLLAATALALTLSTSRVHATGWVALTGTAPNSVDLMLLLPDGTVMCHELGGNSWYLLSPDSTGHYVNGRWTTLTPMVYTRNFFSSCILPDGRVYVGGGEYGTGGSTAEVYDPKADPKNPWHELTLPADPWTNTNFPTAFGNPNQLSRIIRDADSEVLADGNVQEFAIYPLNSNETFFYDPSTDIWSVAPSGVYGFSEATVLKLPDDSLLSADVHYTNSNGSQRYIPALNKFQNDGTVPVSLEDASVSTIGPETGPAALLPNGKALFISGTHTASGGLSALYAPSGAQTSGTWSPGAFVPGGYVGRDAPCAMMNNGKVLCALSPDGNNANQFPSPTALFEYDYTNGTVGTFAPVQAPVGSTGSNGYIQDQVPSYNVYMLDLPDGTILYSDYSNQLYVYTPASNTNATVTALRPAISGISLNSDGSYHLAGTLLNGISEGATYGDDAQMATNYPIVSLKSGSAVYYARTHNWSNTGVMKIGKTVSTEFDLPPALPNGTYSLTVSANGLQSSAVSFSVSIVWVDFNNGSSGNGTYSNPYNTIAAAVNASSSGGVIDIKNPGFSTETLLISSEVNIVASNGAATIGANGPISSKSAAAGGAKPNVNLAVRAVPAGHSLGMPGVPVNRQTVTSP